MPGYREEHGVDPLSSTETFVAMRLSIQNWRWNGVPVYVRTGKRLPARVTEVAMQFHHPPQLPLFPGTDEDLEPDALVVRVQPDEGLSLRFGAKVPGHAFRVQKASMDFSYESFEQQSIDAYERVILDALIGDPTLFIRADEVGRSWKIVDPVLQFWAGDGHPIPLYQAATWGPPEAGGPARGRARGVPPARAPRSGRGARCGPTPPGARPPGAGPGPPGGRGGAGAR